MTANNEWTHTFEDGSKVSVWETALPDPHDEPRDIFGWIVMGADYMPLAAGYDLRSGCNFRPSAFEMAGVLAGFISAWVESLAYPESENHNLFPAEMQQWAESNCDEFFLVTYDDDDEG